MATAGHKQSKFLECIGDSLLTQVIEGPTGAGTLMNLVLTNKDELVRDVKAGDSLGCGEHEREEFRMLKGGNKAKSRNTTLDTQESRHQPLGELLGCIQCRLVLDRRGAQEVDFSRITSPKLKNGPFQHAGSQAKVAGGRHG